MTKNHEYFSHSAISVRMRHLIANLDAAIAANDLSQIDQADHALRNEVIALVGSTDLMQYDASERVTVLSDALLAVRRAVTALVDKAAKQTTQKNAKLVYLNTERARRRSA